VTTPFKDHFSAYAGDYASYRPRYPRELFTWLANVAPAREHAWDCATGNGQAAVALAGHFARVTASDASPSQLAHAEPHARVTYVRARSEDCPLAGASTDLVTIAQALHWFELDTFYAQVRRVLRPRGVIAAWCYDLLVTDDAPLDALVREIYEDVLGPYWSPERRDVENGYANLAFPFERITPPPFAMTARWNFARFTGYAKTWSASNAYRKQHGVDAIDAWAARAAPVWGESERVVRWPLAVHAGRVD
jgi:ubiquinone/menaquinone biosynthesis C-methylase UbiE